MTEDELLRKIKHSDSYAKESLKSKLFEREVRVKEVVEEEKKTKRLQRTFSLFKEGIPKSKKVPRKGRMKGNKPHQLSIGSMNQKQKLEDREKKNNLSLNVESRLHRERGSFEPPQIGLVMPTPDKLEKFSYLDSEYLELENEMNMKEIGSERVSKALDYFMLEEEKDQ